MAVALVDDDPSVRRGVSRLLRMSGFQVSEFTSGEAFLNSLEHAMPGCVVMDIHMAGMTGIEVRAELDRTRMLVPVIFMTADEETAARVTPCLTKPFTKAQLLSLIYEVLPKR